MDLPHSGLGTRLVLAMFPGLHTQLLRATRAGLEGLAKKATVAGPGSVNIMGDGDDIITELA